MALVNHGPQQGATTTDASNSRTAKEFYGESGVVWGGPEEARQKWNDAMLRAIPPSHQTGQRVTTTDDAGHLLGPRMTCSKCGASAAVLVNDPGSPGHEICVSCAHCEELAYPAAGVIIPQTKERLEPTRSMIEP